jgi:flagellar biosynthesis protein FliR
VSGGPVEDIAACWALLSIRFAVALRLTPFMGGRPVPLLACGGLGAALAMVILPLGTVSAIGALGPGGLLLCALREAAIGAGLGAMARMAYSVLEIGGTLAGVATEIGGGPGDDGPPGPLATLYVMTGIAAFLLMGGHRVLVGGLAASVRLFPVAGGAGAGVPDGLLEGAVAILAGAFAFGVMMAAPLFVAGLFARIVIALVARAAPGLTEAAGVQSLRSLVVQLTAIAVLGAGVFGGVEFLAGSLERIAGPVGQ